MVRLWISEGWLHLTTMIDLFSRQIVGWQMSNRIDQDLANDALNANQRFACGVNGKTSLVSADYLTSGVLNADLGLWLQWFFYSFVRLHGKRPHVDF